MPCDTLDDHIKKEIEAQYRDIEKILGIYIPDLTYWNDFWLRNFIAAETSPVQKKTAAYADQLLQLTYAEEIIYSAILDNLAFVFRTDSQQDRIKASSQILERTIFFSEDMDPFENTVQWEPYLFTPNVNKAFLYHVTLSAKKLQDYGEQFFLTEDLEKYRQNYQETIQVGDVVVRITYECRKNLQDKNQYFKTYSLFRDGKNYDRWEEEYTKTISLDKEIATSMANRMILLLRKLGGKKNLALKSLFQQKNRKRSIFEAQLAQLFNIFFGRTYQLRSLGTVQVSIETITRNPYCAGIEAAKEKIFSQACVAAKQGDFKLLKKMCLLGPAFTSVERLCHFFDSIKADATIFETGLSVLREIGIYQWGIKNFNDFSEILFSASQEERLLAMEFPDAVLPFIRYRIPKISAVAMPTNNQNQNIAIEKTIELIVILRAGDQFLFGQLHETDFYRLPTAFCSEKAFQEEPTKIAMQILGDKTGFRGKDIETLGLQQPNGLWNFGTCTVVQYVVSEEAMEMGVCSLPEYFRGIFLGTGAKDILPKHRYLAKELIDAEYTDVEKNMYYFSDLEQNGRLRLLEIMQSGQQNLLNQHLRDGAHFFGDYEHLIQFIELLFYTNNALMIVQLEHQGFLATQLEGAIIERFVRKTIEGNAKDTFDLLPRTQPLCRWLVKYKGSIDWLKELLEDTEINLKEQDCESLFCENTGVLEESNEAYLSVLLSSFRLNLFKQMQEPTFHPQCRQVLAFWEKYPNINTLLKTHHFSQETTDLEIVGSLLRNDEKNGNFCINFWLFEAKQSLFWSSLPASFYILQRELLKDELETFSCDPISFNQAWQQLQPHEKGYYQKLFRENKKLKRVVLHWCQDESNSILQQKMEKDPFVDGNFFKEIFENCQQLEEVALFFPEELKEQPKKAELLFSYTKKLLSFFQIFEKKPIKVFFENLTDIAIKIFIQEALDSMKGIGIKELNLIRCISLKENVATNLMETCEALKIPFSFLYDEIHFTSTDFNRLSISPETFLAKSIQWIREYGEVLEWPIPAVNQFSGETKEQFNSSILANVKPHTLRITDFSDSEEQEKLTSLIGRHGREILSFSICLQSALEEIDLSNFLSFLESFLKESTSLQHIEIQGNVFFDLGMEIFWEAMRIILASPNISILDFNDMYFPEVPFSSQGNIRTAPIKFLMGISKETPEAVKAEMVEILGGSGDSVSQLCNNLSLFSLKQKKPRDGSDDENTDQLCGEFSSVSLAKRGRNDDNNSH